MINETKAIFNEYGNIVALLFGILGQLLAEDKPTRRFVVNLIWASLLVGIYIIPIIIEYIHIDPDSKVAKGLYALSPMVSLQLVALLAVSLPKALQKKLLFIVGVNEKELQDDITKSSNI